MRCFEYHDRCRSLCPTGVASRGHPFEIGNAVVISDRPLHPLPAITTGWLVFLHTSDIRPSRPGPAASSRRCAGAASWASTPRTTWCAMRWHRDALGDTAPSSPRHVHARVGRELLRAVAHHKPGRDDQLTNRRRIGVEPDARERCGFRTVGQLAVGVGEPRPARPSPRCASNDLGVVVLSESARAM